MTYHNVEGSTTAGVLCCTSSPLYLPLKYSTLLPQNITEKHKWGKSLTKTLSLLFAEKAQRDATTYVQEGPDKTL